MRAQATIDYILMLSMGLVITLSIAGIFTQFTGVFKSAQDRTKEIGDQTTAIIPKDVGLAFITKAALLPVQYKDVYDVFNQIVHVLENAKKTTSDSSKKAKLDNMIIELKKMNNRMADEDSYLKLLTIIEQVKAQIGSMQTQMSGDIKMIPVDIEYTKDKTVGGAMIVLGELLRGRLDSFKTSVELMSKVETFYDLVSEVTEFRSAPKGVNGLGDMRTKSAQYIDKLGSAYASAGAAFSLLSDTEKTYITATKDELITKLGGDMKMIDCYSNKIQPSLDYVDSAIAPKIGMNTGTTEACIVDYNKYDHILVNPFDNPIKGVPPAECPTLEGFHVTAKAVDDGFVFAFGEGDNVIRKFVKADNPSVAVGSKDYGCKETCKLYSCLGVEVDAVYGGISNTLAYKLIGTEVVDVEDVKGEEYTPPKAPPKKEEITPSEEAPEEVPEVVGGQAAAENVIAQIKSFIERRLSDFNAEVAKPENAGKDVGKEYVAATPYSIDNPEDETKLVIIPCALGVCINYRGINKVVAAQYVPNAIVIGGSGDCEGACKVALTVGFTKNKDEDRVYTTVEYNAYK